MYYCSLLVAIALAADAASAETILGAFVFSRHGDRTSKSTPPTSLTPLGYREVFTQGTYYRDRYIAANSSTRIRGIEPETVSLSQISVSVPEDSVLQNSAQGWLQGLYPPVGSAAAGETLRNGSTISSPLDGYQLIPLGPVTTGSGADHENQAWLQGATDCSKAKASSNAYFSSDSYQTLLTSTADLYQSLAPVLLGTFTPDELSYRNAYAIWDHLNVGMIHNSTADSPALDTVSDATMRELAALASIHEFNLAFNASDPVRAIAGAVLAGDVLTALSKTITSHSSHPKLTVQFGPYATFLSYFGLAQLSAAVDDDRFTGIPDYASSMAWELVTNNASSDSIPSEDEISVRFLFNNGSSATSPGLEPYPLFGQERVLLPWKEFVARTKEFAVIGQEQWCRVCGSDVGVCAGIIDAEVSSKKTPGGMSNAVAGVIGALVTLGVVLGMETLVLLLGGLRLTRKTPSAVHKEFDVASVEKK
ncbi:hypothetical protein VTN31DRAFT_6135 [Thermomyces dupontii]|uniref:uncharacterized protein n=1 Tax=Talaromyces thermophilus TaxID=28565 RepID=UPI0037435B15